MVHRRPAEPRGTHSWQQPQRTRSLAGTTGGRAEAAREGALDPCLFIGLDGSACRRTDDPFAHRGAATRRTYRRPNVDGPGGAGAGNLSQGQRPVAPGARVSRARARATHPVSRRTMGNGDRANPAARHALLDRRVVRICSSSFRHAGRRRRNAGTCTAPRMLPCGWLLSPTLPQTTRSALASTSPQAWHAGRRGASTCSIDTRSVPSLKPTFMSAVPPMRGAVCRTRGRGCVG